MMVSLNLATHPFENRRRFYVLALGAGVLLVAVTTLLLGTFIRNFKRGRDVSQESSGLRAQAAQLDSEQKRLEEALERPEAMDVMDRSQFLNSLIRQKAVSWTQIFRDLETLMPERVQVVSVRPVVRPEARATTGPVEMDLQMAVSSENMAGLLDLLRRMEKSGNFRQPVLRLENPPQSGSGETLFLLQMSVLYAQK